jgi:NitT/TauT family transport system substrate-binding protein
VEVEQAPGGAAIAPRVVGGELEFGFSNTVSLLIAAAQDLPVLIIAQGALGGTEEDDAWAELLVRADGGLRTGRDLEGGTIAVNTLNNICEVTIKAALEKEGADVSTLTFVEMPIPAMRGALARREVDAACVVEPYVTQAEAGGGARGIVPFYVRTAPDLTVATYFTSRRYAREQQRVVERFVRAIDASLTYAEAHPGEVRRILPTYAEIPPGTAERIKLPTWRADLNRPTIGLLARLSERYGLIEAQPDLDALIRAPR